jgi:hypothetical protein
VTAFTRVLNVSQIWRQLNDTVRTLGSVLNVNFAGKADIKLLIAGP